MAANVGIYDRWHKTHPKLNDADPAKNDKPCKCSRGKNKLYPSSEHEKGLRWQVRYADNEGKSCRRNFSERSGDDPEIHAEAFAAKTKNELDTDRYTDPSKGKITLQEFADDWRLSLTGKPGTIQNVNDRLAHIIEIPPRPGQRKSRRKGPAGSIIADQPMATLARRPSLIQKWIKSLQEKGLSAQYIQHITNTLSSIFYAALDDGVVGRNPVLAQSVNTPSVRPKLVVPWTLKQLRAAAARLAEDDPRNAAMVDLGAGAGLRRGEIFAISQDDIDFLGRVIKVRRQIKKVDGVLVFSLPKRDKIREVPLSDVLGMTLSAHIKEHPSVAVTLPFGSPDGPAETARLLFLRSDGRPWWGGDFTYKWQAARAAAGVPATRENGMHAMRHTFASACLANGVDIRSLADYLGHSDPAFTLRRYAHLMPSSADKVRMALKAFFSPESDDADALEMPSQA